MKVLFLDYVNPILVKILEDRGFTCLHDYSSPSEQIVAKLDNIEGIVIRSRIRIDANFLKHAKQLKFIARSGSGLENIDVDYCRSNGIMVYNSPEGNRDAVGEHIIGMLLTLFNKINIADREVRKGQWRREENRGLELMGKTVGIIGVGNTGMALAKKLSGFDCNILGYDKYVAGFGNNFITEVDLQNIMDNADVISIHVPYNEETHYMLNQAFFNKLKKNVFIINTSRGKCLNTNDLLNGLKSGKISGACLDVLEYELNSFEHITEIPSALVELFKMNQVIFSPHIAGWTVESNEKLVTTLGKKIAADFQLF
ncbi:MAG: NAD(P)-dependent oxidoreductase [Luteibaculaceae bacterium]